VVEPRGVWGRPPVGLTAPPTERQTHPPPVDHRGCGIISQYQVMLDTQKEETCSVAFLRWSRKFHREGELDLEGRVG